MSYINKYNNAADYTAATYLHCRAGDNVRDFQMQGYKSDSAKSASLSG
jgi:hypothetical protein